MAASLTKTQYSVYEFIKRYILVNGISPTMTEIGEGVGICSKGVIHRHVQNLVSHGLLTVTPKRHRNIRLVNDEQADYCLPVLGCIAAGRPIEALNQDESLNVATSLLGANRYALRVKGDSMIEEGIHDDDIIICQQANSARSGQIVVALIDSSEVTLKRLQNNQDGTVSLIPANANFSPQVFNAPRVAIQGIYVGLLRLVS